MEAETLGLFGASGRTGKHIMEDALEKGWNVQALVRNPSKLDLEHENLKVIQGDFTNDAAVQEMIFKVRRM